MEELNLPTAREAIIVAYIIFVVFGTNFMPKVADAVGNGTRRLLSRRG
jgi:Sec-independent protein translocase protein TatA